MSPLTPDDLQRMESQLMNAYADFHESVKHARARARIVSDELRGLEELIDREMLRLIRLAQESGFTLQDELWGTSMATER
jgi:hypothetical protein